MKKFIITLLVLSSITLIGCGTSDSKNEEGFTDSEIESIAKCMTEKGAVLYGAVWCPHCTDQKALFGDSIKFINYIECDPNTNQEQAEICLEKEVEALPTWDLPTGERIVGKHSISVLAEKTNCEI